VADSGGRTTPKTATTTVIAVTAATATETEPRGRRAGRVRTSDSRWCQCRTVARRPFRRIGVSMNRHEAAARAIVTPVSMNHAQAEVGPDPASAAARAITGQCHRYIP
jgi:hypothetical protein